MPFLLCRLFPQQPLSGIKQIYAQHTYGKMCQIYLSKYVKYKQQQQQQEQQYLCNSSAIWKDLKEKISKDISKGMGLVSVTQFVSDNSFENSILQIPKI